MARSVTLPPMAPADSPAPARRPLWRNGGFLVILIGQFASNAGSGATQIALPLLILALTNSPLQASVFEALRLGLYACTAVPAGVLVDRVNPRGLMIVCDFVRALLLATIPIAAFYGVLAISQLYVVVAIEAMLWTVFDLAALALLPSLVADEQVNDVGASITLANNAQQFIGQPFGAVIMQVGRYIPFAVNALTYALSALSLLFVRIASAPSAPATSSSSDVSSDVSSDATGAVDREPPEPTARSAARGLFAGFRWLWSHELLRTLALVCSLANLALAGYTLLLLVVLRTLGASAADFGVVLLAAGVGSLIGPALGAALGRRVPAMLIFLLGLPMEAGLWVMTLVVATPLVVTTPLIASAPTLLAPLAFLTMTVDQAMAVAQYTTRMRLIPADMRGRAQSAYRLLLTISQPIGLPLMGLGLQVWGVTLTVLAGVVVLMLAWAIAFATPAVRHAAQEWAHVGAGVAVAGGRWAALGATAPLWSVGAWLDAVGDERVPAFFTGTLQRRAGQEGALSASGARRRATWTAMLTGPLAPPDDAHPAEDKPRGARRDGS